MLLLLLAVIGVQPKPAEAPGHGGFFVRLDLGFGWYESHTGSAAWKGPAGGLGVAIGAGSGNFAVFASLFDAATAQPTIEVPGNTATPSDTTAAISALGLGATYYLMPANVFLSGTVGYGGFSVGQGGTTYATRPGLVARAGAGKEWMVSSSWGLGVAAYLNFARNDDQGSPATWTTLSPLLSFSATFY